MVANNGISKGIASQIPEFMALVRAMQDIGEVTGLEDSWRMWAESYVCLVGYRGVLGIRMSSNCSLRSACIPLLFMRIPIVPACGRVVPGIGRAVPGSAGLGRVRPGCAGLGRAVPGIGKF